MVGKREARNAEAPAKGRKQARKKVQLSPLAEGMFLAYGKNPYVKGDITIHNLDELQSNLESFEHHEAPWLADWIDYLGDAETAKMIRTEPSSFKKIIHQRWSELKKQFQ
jgi:hypothetical protein